MDLTIAPVESSEKPKELSFEDSVLLLAIYASTNDLKVLLNNVPQETKEEKYNISLALKNCLDYYVSDYKISQTFFNKVYKPSATDSRWHTWKFIYDYYSELNNQLKLS